DEGRSVALATVVEVVRKAPRDPGTTMAVNDRGEIAGSVSGGCVEPAVVEVAQEVLATGQPRLVTFGISDDQAFEVGLSCGGAIHVWVEAVSAGGTLGPHAAGAAGRGEAGAVGPTLSGPLLHRLAAALREGRAVALVRVLAAGDDRPTVRPGAVLLVHEAPEDGHAGSTGDAGLDSLLASRAREFIARGVTARERVGGADAFIHAFTPPPVLYIIGAVHPAAALAEAGRFLGYRVVVCDPRSPFATPERIPAAHEIVRRWPDEYLASVALTPRDAVCVLTHDLKFDVPALLAALRTPVGYIGVMGSRRTHERRVAALREAGVAEEELRRLHAPIGLEIGARTPEELAIAIVAEIVASRNGAAGTRIPVTT
ncbi:MAG TPA: XdhC/CoxI family protein, partial [Thermaerobacter sp.]